MDSPTADTNYVYCVLVMSNEEYVVGAAVVAESLRATGAKYPIWCMVADIRPAAVEILKTQFDHVVEVPIIEHPCLPMKTAKQDAIYGSWIHKSFTKWNIMNPELFPCAKVLLLDADLEVKSNIDDLFDLEAPAATFSSSWASPYVEPTRRRPPVPAKSAKPWHTAQAATTQAPKWTPGVGAPNPYVDVVRNGRTIQYIERAHGQIVEPARIRKGFNGSCLGLACMVLVRPSAKSYTIMRNILAREGPYGTPRCISGFDEQLLAEVWLAMNEPIYNIHQSYNWVVGKTRWLMNGEKPKTHQFYNGKPWRNIRSPAERQKNFDHITWTDVQEWWMVADRLMESKPVWRLWFYPDEHAVM